MLIFGFAVLKRICVCSRDFRRGSWRPIGHMRPSSPLLDSVRDQFEDYDQLAKDFTRFFLNTEPNTNAMMFDVSFLVGQSKQKVRFIGVRAILGVRSRYIFVMADEILLLQVRLRQCVLFFCALFLPHCFSPEIRLEIFSFSSFRAGQIKLFLVVLVVYF